MRQHGSHSESLREMDIKPATAQTASMHGGFRTIARVGIALVAILPADGPPPHPTAKRILAADSSNWPLLLSMAKAAPEDERRLAYGTACRKLATERPELWPGHAEAMARHMDPDMMNLLAREYGERTQDRPDGAERLSLTLSHHSLPPSTKVRFSKSYLNWHRNAEREKIAEALKQIDDLAVLIPLLGDVSPFLGQDVVLEMLLVQLGNQDPTVGQASAIGTWLAERNMEISNRLTDAMTPRLSELLADSYRTERERRNR